MNNAEVIKGLESIIEGCNLIKKSLSEQTEKEVMNEPTSTEGVSVEDLKAMNYNDFKKYASQLGVKCTGTREQILQRVLNALGESEGEPANEEIVEEKTKSSKSAKSKKTSKEEVDEDSEDEFDIQAKEIADENSVEDIIEALAEVDVKATKKNYVDKLAYALREGLLDLEDGDDEEKVVSGEAEEDDVEFEPTSYFEEFDPEGINDPEDMTKKRAKAIEKRMASIIGAVEEEELSAKDVSAYIEDNATDDEKELLEDYDADPFEKNLMLYMELVKKTIDDDGEEHEPCEPYEIGEENLCCGHILKYSKKTKKFICEICGTEYEAE